MPIDKKLPVKDFDRWNTKKKGLDLASLLVDFHEREIWWCSIGVNVGSEQHSQTDDFSRPVIIVKKFTRDVFWGIPLTTRLKDANFRFRVKIDDMENDALILQMRVYDRRRLVRKIGMMRLKDFGAIMDFIKNLMQKTNPA